MIHNHFQIYWAWSAWVVIRELSDFHDKFDLDRNEKFDLDRNSKFDLDGNDKFDLCQDLISFVGSVNIHSNIFLTEGSWVKL